MSESDECLECKKLISEALESFAASEGKGPMSIMCDCCGAILEIKPQQFSYDDPELEFKLLEYFMDLGSDDEEAKILTAEILEATLETLGLDDSVTN
jgi:hypothetical protein